MQQLRHLPSSPPPEGRQNIRWSGACMQSRSAQHKTSIPFSWARGEFPFAIKMRRLYILNRERESAPRHRKTSCRMDRCMIVVWFLCGMSMRQLRHLPFSPPPKGRQNIRWSGVCMQSRSAQHKTSMNRHALRLWGSMLQWRMEKRDVYVHDVYCKTNYAFCAFACCEHACSS